MNFTDIFIRRPVLASVVSLLILVLGIRAFYALPVLQYPRTENAVVTITTTYYGADPDMVAGFITTPLEIAIAQAYGIDYMTSSSQSHTYFAVISENAQMRRGTGRAMVRSSQIASAPRRRYQNMRRSSYQVHWRRC